MDVPAHRFVPETTATTLTITLAMLALFQDEQEKVYRKIVDRFGMICKPVRLTWSVISGFYSIFLTDIR